MFRFTSLLLIGLSLLGCATMEESKKEQELAEALLYYEKAVRWADFSRADKLRRLAPDVTERQHPTDIHITGYREVGRRQLDGGNEIEIAVRIDYYQDDTLKVSSIVDQQHWVYKAAEESWYITTTLPDFR